MARRENRGGEGFIEGLLGGAVAGGIVAGLMKIRPTPTAITASREVIPRQNITAVPATLKDTTTYKFAIVLFHGDGDSTLTLTVTRGTQTFTLYGNEQAIEIVVNENFKVEATSGSGYSPTIEIAYLSW